MRYINSRGYECFHVLDLDLARESDRRIWRYASENELVVISKDEDFVYLSGAFESKARLIWVRCGNCRTPALLDTFDRSWLRIIDDLSAGERVVELR